MQLATDSADFATGALGMVELVLSYMNDRSKKYYSKAECIEYLNHAQQKIAGLINRLHRTHFLTSATTTVVAGQAYYSFPADMVKLAGLELLEDSADTTGKRLVEVPMKDRRFYELLAAANKQADYDFFFIAGTTFKIMPNAESVVSEEMRVHYVKRLAALVDNADESEIPEEYHELVCLDAARRGFIKVNRTNAQLETMWGEGVEVMRQALDQYSPQREMRVEPDWGSYGPGSQLWDQFIGAEVD